VAPTLAVNDLERARRFYEDKLGLEADVQVADTVRYRCGGGTGISIFERPRTPIDRTVAAFEVEDIEAEVAPDGNIIGTALAEKRWFVQSGYSDSPAASRASPGFP
jgi:catechol 2,3-dioxygenase-like lactoylglutathione lyase family enzyme